MGCRSGLSSSSWAMSPNRSARHLDLATTDRAAEVKRHEGLGAERVARHERFTVLRDPADSPHCVHRPRARNRDAGLIRWSSRRAPLAFRP